MSNTEPTWKKRQEIGPRTKESSELMEGEKVEQRCPWRKTTLRGDQHCEWSQSVLTKLRLRTPSLCQGANALAALPVGSKNGDIQTHRMARFKLFTYRNPMKQVRGKRIRTCSISLRAMPTLQQIRMPLTALCWCMFWRMEPTRLSTTFSPQWKIHPFFT